AADPGANVLHFTLGNQLAQQGRWAEAQQAYFKAMAADPDNPDFAFNLAVSLDHLRQSKLAADYYRRAIALAEKHGASFDLAAAPRPRTSPAGPAPRPPPPPAPPSAETEPEPAGGPRMNPPANPQAKRHIGQILIDQGILTEDQLRIALLEQTKSHVPVGRLLV